MSVDASPPGVPVSQYVYFALRSRTVPAAEMSATIGLDPDEILVRGSRFTHPKPVPVSHSWSIVCRAGGRSVDEQVACVLARLAPYVESIAALTRRIDDAEGDGPTAVLEVVRRFNDVRDQDRSSEASSLLGWHLDREVLDFLHATRAALDVDEYDCTPSADNA